MFESRLPFPRMDSSQINIVSHQRANFRTIPSQGAFRNTNRSLDPGESLSILKLYGASVSCVSGQSVLKVIGRLTYTHFAELSELPWPGQRLKRMQTMSGNGVLRYQQLSKDVQYCRGGSSGYQQLLAIWRRAKGKERDVLRWGDEVGLNSPSLTASWWPVNSSLPDRVFSCRFRNGRSQSQTFIATSGDPRSLGKR